MLKFDILLKKGLQKEAVQIKLHHFPNLVLCSEIEIEIESGAFFILLLLSRFAGIFIVLFHDPP